MICVAPEANLSRYVEQKFAPLRLVGKRPKTIEAYDTMLRVWNRTNSILPIDRIDDLTLAIWKQSLLKTIGPASVNCYMRHLMAILRFAKKKDDIELVPEVEKMREPKRSPLALTLEEFKKVLATAEMWKRPIGGLPAKPWWRSLLLADWESGLRFTALLSIRSIDIIFASKGFICQADDQKDAEAMWFQLSDQTLSAIKEIYDPTREFLWPRHVKIAQVGRWFRQILDHAGIYAPKGCGLRFHRIRKSKASYTEALGGNPTQALGHSCRAVTERYLDPRIVSAAKQPPMPMPF